jgi:phage shock protein C
MSIYCAQCGKESADGARFCSICGRPLSLEASQFVPGSATGAHVRTLVRPRFGRKVAGVCQGLANYYGWDVMIVRIVILLLAIAAFPIGLILYGIIWLVAPEEPFALPATTSVSQN